MREEAQRSSQKANKPQCRERHVLEKTLTQSINNSLTEYLIVGLEHEG